VVANWRICEKSVLRRPRIVRRLEDLLRPHVCTRSFATTKPSFGFSYCRPQEVTDKRSAHTAANTRFRHTLSTTMVSTIRECETPSGCHADTGYFPSTLQYILEKYSGPDYTFRGQLPRRTRQPWMRIVYFYCYFVLMHLQLHMDRPEEWSQITSGRVAALSEGLSEDTIRYQVLPIGDALAALIDEVDADLRYNPYNHAPFFRTRYTAIVDTFPVYVTGTGEFASAQMLWGEKYQRYIYKVQIGVNFLGEIVLWTGLHFGREADITIWETTWADHPFRPGERWLADLGYIGAFGLLCKIKRRPRGRRGGPRPALTRPQRLFNNVHEHVRNRSENVIGKVKAHAFLRNTFTGSYETLASMVKVTGHVTAYELRQFQRFKSYGPWPH
jgi:hypothetical protein